MTNPLHNPAPDYGINVSELKKFNSLEEIERHVRTSLEGDRYRREHSETTRFIRRGLKPKE